MKCLIVSFVLVLSFCQAQTIRIGLVLSQTGSARAIGQAQLSATQVLRAQLRATPLGRNIEVIFRDDGSNVINTAKEIQDLVENEEVHILICCTLDSMTKAVSPYLEEARVPTLSLSPLESDLAPYWLFSVKPDSSRILQSVLLQQSAQGKGRLGLMTFDNAYGHEVKANLSPLLSAEAGTELVVEQRYKPDATVLTPEALWVATRGPNSVLLWGLSRDSLLAYEALRLRGYEQDIILNPNLLEPAFGSLDLYLLDGAQFPISAIQVSDLPNDHAMSASSQTFIRDMTRVYGPENIPYQGAYAYDAFNLARSALEVALSYGVEPGQLNSFRQATRDALIGMAVYRGATAIFDYSETDHVGIDPYSLVLATAKRGKLSYQP